MFGRLGLSLRWPILQRVYPVFTSLDCQLGAFLKFGFFYNNNNNRDNSNNNNSNSNSKK